MLIKHGKYKIVLKPAAVLLMAIVLGYLGRSLLASGFVAISSAFAAHRVVADPLQNRAFEPPYMPIGAPVPHQVADVSGSVSNYWEDRSRWNDVSVEYAPSTSNPQSDKTNSCAAGLASGGSTIMTPCIPLPTCRA